jgi:hypothetical protein
VNKAETEVYLWSDNIEIKVDCQRFPDMKISVYIHLENFSKTMISVNLDRIERWPKNRVIAISDLTTCQQTGKRKQGRCLNNSNCHPCVERSLTTTAIMLLTSYHKIPTNFLGAHRSQCHTPLYWVLVTGPSSNMKTRILCWLA